ncbi:MAG TPA: SIMPL domain-containing protein [Acidobacteriaceae bacterium]
MRPLFRLPLLAFSLAATSLVTAAQTIQINQQNKTIAINTTDEATATADIAAITIGFELYDNSSESAYLTAGKLSKAIMEALHKAGIEDKNIESDKQNLSRNMNFNADNSAGTWIKKEFHFEQSWEVTTSAAQVAAVLHAAIAAGANASGDITWRLSDLKTLQAKAAASALVKARAMASQMAEGLHVKLGGLIYASNVSPIARALLNTSNATVEVTGGAPPPPPPPLEIRPQTIREEATVYAVFAIE